MENHYNGGTIFFDHYSGFTWINCQVLLRVGETLEGKHAFEHFAKQHGVKLKNFRADNQPFDSEEWHTDLELNNQMMSLSGVGSTSPKWSSRASTTNHHLLGPRYDDAPTTPLARSILS